MPDCAACTIDQHNNLIFIPTTKDVAGTVLQPGTMSTHTVKAHDKKRKVAASIYICTYYYYYYYYYLYLK